MKALRETDLCEEFMATAVDAGWTCYAESCGFDILLTRGEVQIGVEAKLHMNLEVIGQAFGERGGFEKTRTPHFRAILVPYNKSGTRAVTHALKLWVFEGKSESEWRRARGRGIDFLYAEDVLTGYPHYVWEAPKRMVLPEFVPRVPAGVPSPVQLTKWKISMLRMLADMMNNGFMTSPRAKKVYGIDMTIPIQKRWVVQNGCEGRCYRFEINDKALDRPDQVHPEVFQMILRGGADVVPTQADLM